MNTRNGTGGTSRPLTSSAAITLQVWGMAGAPQGATAVAINVTVTNSTGYGNVAVNPDGVTPSGTSNLNYVSGQTVPNMVIVPIGDDGAIRFTKQGPGQVDLIADMSGYVTTSASPSTSAGYTGTNPTRLLDTRSGIVADVGKLGAGTVLRLQVPGGDVPGGTTAVAVNLTLTDATGFGDVPAWC